VRQIEKQTGWGGVGVVDCTIAAANLLERITCYDQTLQVVQTLSKYPP